MTPDDRIHAAELVLGVIDSDERVAALERMLAEPAFAREVAWWQSKLMPLLAEYDTAEPNSETLTLVEKLISERSAVGVAVAPRRRWPLALGGAAAGAIAASLVALLLLPDQPVSPVRPASSEMRAMLVTALAPTEGQDRAPVAVLIDTDARALKLIGAIEVPAGRSAEVWRIGSDKVPVALGIIGQQRIAQLKLSDRSLPRVADVIAVSIEPLGGATGTSPTGPVIATGVLSET